MLAFWGWYKSLVEDEPIASRMSSLSRIRPQHTRTGGTSTSGDPNDSDADGDGDHGEEEQMLKRGGSDGQEMESMLVF